MGTNKYLSIKDISESGEYPFTIGQMRHYLIMRHKNGLASAVRKIGKRLYIKEDLFLAWIESQTNDGGNL